MMKFCLFSSLLLCICAGWYFLLKIYQKLTRFLITLIERAQLKASPQLLVTLSKEADEDEFKYMVSLRLAKEPRRHMCGGAIINEKWILTARQCLIQIEEGKNKTWSIRGANSIVVVPKYANNLDNLYEPKFEPEETFCWFFYNFDISNPHPTDYGLIKLKRAIPLGALSPYGLREIALDGSAPGCSKDPFKDGRILSAGWGVNKGGKLSSSLQRIELQIQPDSVCKVNPAYAYYLTFCAKGVRVNVSTDLPSICAGDMGSPAVYRCPNKQDKLVGIASAFDVGCL